MTTLSQPMYSKFCDVLRECKVPDLYECKRLIDVELGSRMREAERAIERADRDAEAARKRLEQLKTTIEELEKDQP